MLQVGAHRPVPVDLAQARPRIAQRATQRSVHCLPQWLSQASLDVVDHLTHDKPRGLARPGGNDPRQRDKRRHQMYVRLHLGQELRFEQELFQPEPFERVALHDAHDRRWKIRADVAQPAGDARR